MLALESVQVSADPASVASLDGCLSDLIPRMNAWREVAQPLHPKVHMLSKSTHFVD
jgi:hypothetical protein